MVLEVIHQNTQDVYIGKPPYLMKVSSKKLNPMTFRPVPFYPRNMPVKHSSIISYTYSTRVRLYPVYTVHSIIMH